MHDWWLAPGLRDASLAAVERALRRLVAAERLVAVVMPDGSTLFAKPPDDRGSPGPRESGRPIPPTAEQEFKPCPSR